ncbi:MAG: Crp/Fnr family transcriptional regulator [Pirellulaceae bacterium]|jgi:CRP-like cAMP-binding protein|nr:Crp/Fnr family transcriptional regulator [Pirellulaceae bacterium]MDP6557021.1 Crp/Fnr family transcriptional regulator [Pirellulaceae bacterium]
MSEKYWFLKRCDLFGPLSDEQLRRMESRCRIREIPRNSPVYLPADAADGMLLLASGRVKICGFTPDGKQSILTFIEPGEVFGELAIFESAQRDEYAEAVLASTVLLIPRDQVQQLMLEQPTLSLGVTKLIGLRRKRIERRLKYLLFHSNRDKLVHLLLELLEQYGKTTAEGIEITLKLSHQDLASIIGATRETVTVNLGELQAAGLIKVGRKRVLVKDVERMAASVSVAAPHSRGEDDSTGQGKPETRETTHFLP